MTTAASNTLAPGSRHEIPVRDPGFAFDASIPRHWLADNPIATHFFNGLNLVFPDGERCFIRAVSDHASEIRDPALREQVSAFFGQEARHAAEHERYFDTLREQGYEIDRFLGRFGRLARLSNRHLPRSLRLAMTAGAEHWTAVFGAQALEDELLLKRAHPTLRNLILWHATEEIEHKAVAFDVFIEAYGRGPLGWLLRMVGYGAATVILFGWTIAGTRMLLRQDDLRRNDVDRARRELRTHHRWANLKATLRAAASYLRPGFHPNETDELGLAHARLAEFGITDGSGAGLAEAPGESPPGAGAALAAGGAA